MLANHLNEPTKERFMFTKIIFDYARGKKRTEVVDRKEYKRGYYLIMHKEVKGRPFASFAAGICTESGKFHIGVTACKPSKIVLEERAKMVDGEVPRFRKIDLGDVFCKEEGRGEAMDRMSEWEEKEIKEYFEVMPRQLVSFFIKFYDRCKKYYQDVEPAFDYLTLLGIAHNEFLSKPTINNRCTDCIEPPGKCEGECEA
jgi:hypothetical protein